MQVQGHASLSCPDDPCRTWCRRMADQKLETRQVFGLQYVCVLSNTYKKLGCFALTMSYLMDVTCLLRMFSSLCFVPERGELCVHISDVVLSCALQDQASRQTQRIIQSRIRLTRCRTRRGARSRTRSQCQNKRGIGRGTKKTPTPEPDALEHTTTPHTTPQTLLSAQLLSAQLSALSALLLPPKRCMRGGQRVRGMGRTRLWCRNDWKRFRGGRRGGRRRLLLWTYVRTYVSR